MDKWKYADRIVIGDTIKIWPDYPNGAPQIVIVSSVKLKNSWRDIVINEQYIFWTDCRVSVVS